MTHELPHDPNLDSVEKNIAAYAPRPPRIDRDRLMFEAGRAAAFSHPPAGIGPSLRQGVIAWFPAPPTLVPASWLWPASTLVMTVVSLGLGIALWAHWSPLERVQIVERVVHVPSPAPPASPQPTLAVSSGRVQQHDEHRWHEPPVQDAPVATLESLPENHLLKVRQVALTQGVDALAPLPGGGTPRLSPPPTRGALMRAMAIPHGGSPSRPALLLWRNWFTAESPR